MSIIEGHASVFDFPYSIGGDTTEVIKPGAFRASLKRSPDIQFLTNHGAGGGLPLARTRSGTLVVSEDRKGLHYKASVDDDDPDAAKLVRAIRRGDLDGASFAFRAVKQRWNEERTRRTLLEVDVDKGDISAVNQGASPAAYSALARGAMTVAERRDAAQALGDRVVIEFRSLTLAGGRRRFSCRPTSTSPGPRLPKLAAAIRPTAPRPGGRGRGGRIPARTRTPMADPPPYSQKEIDELGERGLALKRKNGPGYHYPIQSRRDLLAAIQAFGRQGNSPAVIAFLQELGAVQETTLDLRSGYASDVPSAGEVVPSQPGRPAARVDR